MIVVDSSAIVAIVFGEPLADALNDCITAAESAVMAAANYVETATVLAGRLSAPPRTTWRRLDGVLATFRIEVVPFDQAQARAAVEAYLAFGRGFGPARLNLGDSFAYGLARIRGAPLLFVGNDFTQTDIEPALAQL